LRKELDNKPSHDDVDWREEKMEEKIVKFKAEVSKLKE